MILHHFSHRVSYIKCLKLKTLKCEAGFRHVDEWHVYDLWVICEMSFPKSFQVFARPKLKVEIIQFTRITGDCIKKKDDIRLQHSSLQQWNGIVINILLKVTHFMWNVCFVWREFEFTQKARVYFLQHSQISYKKGTKRVNSDCHLLDKT